MPAVQQTLGASTLDRPVYLNWNDPITVTELDQVVATGGIPMITWNCGDKDADVIAGRDDGQIDQVAAALAQFPAPRVPPLVSGPERQHQRSSMSRKPWCNRAMWRPIQHIHDRLVADGATNVTFVWSVDTTTPQANTSWRTFYPGARTWTGSAPTVTPPRARRRMSPTTSVPGTRTFSADKPLMISQTAAIPGLQAQYIEQLSAVPTQYPTDQGGGLLRRARRDHGTGL